MILKLRSYVRKCVYITGLGEGAGLLCIVCFDAERVCVLSFTFAFVCCSLCDFIFIFLFKWLSLRESPRRGFASDSWLRYFP